jgi:hypothetical protein
VVVGGAVVRAVWIGMRDGLGLSGAGVCELRADGVQVVGAALALVWVVRLGLGLGLGFGIGFVRVGLNGRCLGCSFWRI